MDKILYDYAMSFVGLPYRWGGSNTIDGFDCSGLVIEILQSVGYFPLKYDSTAQGLFDSFKATCLDVMTAKLGSIAFYGSDAQSISHVGFCIDETRMIEAGGGSSKTLTLDDAADQNAYVRIRPFRSRKDLVAIFSPKY